MPIYGSAGNGLIVDPGGPFNGQPTQTVMLQLSRAIQGNDPNAKQQAIQQLQHIGTLPQFHGIGWEGLVSMLGVMGGGALAAGLSGGSSAGAAEATAAGGNGLSSVSLGDVAAGAVPELPSLPSVGLPVSLPSVGGATTSGIGGILSSIFSKKNIPDLISGGTSILGGIIQGRAASNAAGLQANAANHAADLQAQSAKDALDFSKQVYGNEQAANAPFLQAGQNALSQVQGLIAPGGDLSKDFTAPTAEEVRQTPGYQLNLDEAMKALQRTTRGVVNGGTIKAGERYAADYADTKYNEATNRALNIFNTNRSNRLNPLLTIAGYGPQAVSANNAAGTNAVNQNTGITTNAAENIGNLGQQSAFQTASGNIGGTNALTAALQQIANLAQERQALSRSSLG